MSAIWLWFFPQVEFHPTKADSLATGSTDGLVCVFDIGKNNEQDALVTTLNSESTVVSERNKYACTSQQELDGKMGFY